MSQIDPAIPDSTDRHRGQAEQIAELRRQIATLQRRQFNPTEWGLVEPVQHVVGGPGEPGYFPGWQATVSPGVFFSKDAFGNVQLTGQLHRLVGAGGTAFALPSGFRPQTTGAFPVFWQSVPGGAGFGTTIVNILSTGHVNPVIATDAECWLHPIGFRAAA